MQELKSRRKVLCCVKYMVEIFENLNSKSFFVIILKEYSTKKKQREHRKLNT